MIQSYKSVLVAYVLWFFLGWAGVHRFYLGKIGTGLFYLLMSILSISTFESGLGKFLLIVVFIGWFIDLFLIPSKVTQVNLISKALRSGGNSRLNENQPTNINVNINSRDIQVPQKKEEAKEGPKLKSWNTIKKDKKD